MIIIQDKRVGPEIIHISCKIWGYRNNYVSLQKEYGLRKRSLLKLES